MKMIGKSKSPRSVVPADAEMGEKVRARRIDLGMSQSDLAEKLGVSFQQIQKYEKGTNRINAIRLQTVAKILDLEMSAFFENKQMPDVSSLMDVTDKATLRMLKAYGRIKDQDTRRQIVVMMEAIAAADAL
jgi:transcriptional regulator with XRE-family HTH domain